MAKAKVVTDDIFWVGVRDRDIEVFDVVMFTEHGTTYNSYIIKGSEKIALIETCKSDFFDEFLKRVNSFTSVSEIDYLIINHTEPDHSGSIKNILKINPKIVVYGTGVALKNLQQIINMDFNKVVVKDKDSLDIGGMTLEFISVPNLHWPDSMYTYIPERKALFTCDSFGAHYCSEEIFSDLIDKDFSESFKYYYECIMSPFNKFVLKAMSKIENLDIDFICNGHGPVLRDNIRAYIELYKTFAAEKGSTKNLIVIPFVSAYGYTKKMAYKIAEGIKEYNSEIEVKIYDLVEDDYSGIYDEIYDAKGIIVGSCTILSDTLPPVWEVLARLNPMIHSNKIGGVFGSYGWSGEAIPNIETRMNQVKIKMPIESLKICFKPDHDEIDKCVEFGRKFAEELEKIKS